MLTAHLPSGYLLARATTARRPDVFAAMIAGAVFPDLDLIWFYGIDDRAFHHHLYWVHIPGFWIGLAGLVLPILRWRAPGVLPAALGFLSGIALHILLDAIAGGIAWGWPFDGRLITLFEVPARYDNWILSFLLHWTFLLELCIWAAALTLWFRTAP